MEFLVFVIYGIVMSEWIFGKTSKNATGVTGGRDYYKISGMLNMITGMMGMLLFDFLLRGKNIILSGDIFPIAMAHYKSVGKCIKHWVIDGCRDIKPN